MYDAAQYMQEKSVTHLDIKVENAIIINNCLNIQVIDLTFGMIVDERKIQPYTGQVVTPTHMPPEMLQHRWVFTYFIDIY